MKIVLDTNEFVSGVLWKGNEALIINNCIEGKLQNYTSLPILQEFEKVLYYEKFQLSKEEIEKLLQTAISFSIIVIPTISINEIKEDPTDNIFLECALSGDVDYIVTGDKHLLKLNEYMNIKIINGRELLKIIGK